MCLWKDRDRSQCSPCASRSTCCPPCCPPCCPCMSQKHGQHFSYHRCVLNWIRPSVPERTSKFLASVNFAIPAEWESPCEVYGQACWSHLLSVTEMHPTTWHRDKKWDQRDGRCKACRIKFMGHHLRANWAEYAAHLDDKSGVTLERSSDAGTYCLSLESWFVRVVEDLTAGALQARREGIRWLLLLGELFFI